MAARLLIEQGHQVVLHGRNEVRSRDALAAAAGAQGVVSGDLSTIAGTRSVADQVDKLGRFDAVIHNAGVGYRERQVEMEPGISSVFAVNVVAPYILTALIEKPKRLVYVSSGMHRGVRPRMDDLLWTERAWSGASAYAESKLCDVLLAFAIARRWKDSQIERAGARLGGDEDGRPFSAGRSASGLPNPGMAGHQRRRVGTFERWVFLSAAASFAEPDRE